MFEEEDENEYTSIDELLKHYYSIQDGQQPIKYLDPEEFNEIIDYFLENHQFNLALEALETALSFHPNNTDLLMIRAEIMFGMQNFGQAITVLELIDHSNPLYIPGIILYSDILMETDKEEEAIVYIQEKIERAVAHDKVELMMVLSDIYNELARFEDVYQVLTRIILDVDPGFDEALYKLSYWADMADKNEESVLFHQTLLDDNPFNAVAWYNLASAYHSLKKYPEAIDAYEYCIALDAHLEAAYRNVADVYIKVRKFDDAIYALRKNLEIARPEDVLYEAMGLCFEKKKDFKQARHYYRQAIQLSPNEGSFFYKIGETYFREKKYIQAYESYKTALNLDENNHSYALAVATCLFENEEAGSAIVYILKSLSIKPNQKNAWVLLGKCLFTLDMPEEVVKIKESAEEACGEKAEFYFIHTAALLAMGKSKEALVHLRKGLEKAPSKVKLLETLQPDVFTRKSIVDMIARYKK